MKRIISLVLVALLTLSVFVFTGCGAINKSEVSILWSGNGKVEVPNSLINSMERAMYIKNISYKHYGANGNLNTQLEQAKTALNNGCQVLVVELVNDSALDTLAAQQVALDIVKAAKEKSVPVIFFNCHVAEAVVNHYDKCVHISSDENTVTGIQAKIIADYVKANFKDADKNEDKKIDVLLYGTILNGVGVIEKANELLASDDYKVSESLFGEKFNLSVESTITADITEAEMILTPNDVVAYDVLVKLQEKDYNTDKLKTHLVPIVTVGENVDYKDIVVSGRPELPSDLVIKDDDSDKVISDKNQKIKELKELREYYEKNKFLVDLTSVNESDLGVMIYNTINVIDSGRIAGTATEDRDAIAIAVATMVENFVKGNDTFKGIASDTVVVEGNYIKISYIAYCK